MESHIIRFSTNPELVDKHLPSDPQLNAYGFLAVEGSIDDMAKAISEDGWAISYQFKNDHRHTSNFIATDFLAVDIDGGLKLEEALNHPLVEKYCALLYTTVNHSADNHRFRLIFRLPHTITDASDVTAAAKALTHRLGGDPSATDAARMFYGSTDCHIQIFDRTLSEELLAELIIDGKEVSARDSSVSANSTTNRSSRHFGAAQEIRLANGRYVDVSSVIRNTSIYCPYHHDRHPSAFLGIKENGSRYIHCKSCHKTWWMEGANADNYRFYGFEEAVKAIKAQSLNQIDNMPTPFGEFLEATPIQNNHIHLFNDEKLDLNHIQEGITLIKSPKGSGKTTFLARIVKRSIYLYAELSFDEFEEATASDDNDTYLGTESILLIGHRQALIGDLCNRLHLNNYLDDHKYKKHQVYDRQQRYGVCLDSLAKIKDRTYDVIVIDEVEQVLAHFLSDTIGEQRQPLFNLFCEQLGKAKKIIALDADLGWVSFITLTTLVNGRTTALTKRRRITRPSNKQDQIKPVFVILNDNKSDDKSLYLYASEFQLVQHMKDSILAGKRIFITSNSKEKVKTLSKVFTKEAEEAGMTTRIMLVTSENSRSEEIQHFIRNIKTEILNYSVVLSSPSMGTGIDITFENNATEIDCVYGLFVNQINSHFDIDQQIGRVRHPNQVHVWVSPQQFNFETEFNVIAVDYLQDQLINLSIGNENNNDFNPLNELDSFHILASMVVAHQRASKNKLKQNFIEYKQRQGWNIIHVDRDDDLSRSGNALFKIGKHLRDEEYIELIMQSTTMDQYSFMRHKAKLDSNLGSFTTAESYAYLKTRIELFYGQPVTESLIRIHNSGKHPACVRQFERLNEFETMRESVENYSSSSKRDKVGIKLIKNSNFATELLSNLLKLTPVYSNGKFSSKIEFSKDDLVKFTAAATQVKTLIETQFGITIRSNFVDNPVQLVTDLLKIMGLKLEKSRPPKVSAGTKKYFYAISDSTLANMTAIVTHRSDSDQYNWAYVNRTHDFTYTPDQLDWIMDMYR